MLSMIGCIKFSTSTTSTGTWRDCAGAITKAAWDAPVSRRASTFVRCCWATSKGLIRNGNCLAPGRLAVPAQVHRLRPDGGDAGSLYHLPDPAVVCGGNASSRIPVGAEDLGRGRPGGGQDGFH